MLAAEGWDAFYSFEITVAAKAFAIQARPSTNIGKYLHGKELLCERVNKFWALKFSNT
jgi:hypothetical protein